MIPKLKITDADMSIIGKQIDVYKLLTENSRCKSGSQRGSWFDPGGTVLQRKNTRIYCDNYFLTSTVMKGLGEVLQTLTLFF